MGSGGKDKEVKTKKKPGRVPTACAECRRLKLRCDKNVPCAKCTARGCGSICPDGCLTPGKGNRLVLANTEQLHEEIEELRSRNRDLESGLRAVQEMVTDQPHPLLDSNSSRSLLRSHLGSSSGPSTSASSKSPPTSRVGPATQVSEPVELPPEDDSNVLNIFGTLVVGQRETTRFIGKTARPETFFYSHPKSRCDLPKVPQNLLDLAFPPPSRNDFVSDLLGLLPSFAEAYHLCGVYFEYGNFLYNPLSRKELLDEALDTIYKSKTSDPVQKSHTMSLLFIVFAIATLFSQNASPFSPKSQEYYVLSRASLNLAPGGSEVNLKLVQIHVHIAHYLDLSDSNTEPPDSAWIQVGEAVQLAHRMGLHINGSRWNLPNEPIRRRDQVYWNLFVLDAWTSFHVGRPPHIARRHLDRPPLAELGELTTPDARLDGNLHIWNLEFALSLVSIMEALGPKPPVYESILDLDRKIRDMHIPVAWRIPPGNETSSPSLSTYISRWSTLSKKEIVLLNLHRPYFMQALQDSPSDLQRHRYLSSVVAAYRSGWRLIRALAMIWTVAPEFLSRMSIAWSYAFSAGIVMCLYVTQAPTSYLSPAALGVLDHLMSLFNTASSRCHPADRLLSSIKSLHHRAHEAMGSSHMRYDRHSHAISPAELERLAGKSHLIVDPSSSQTISSIEKHSGTSRATSVTMSDIAEHQPAVYHPTENLHPTVAHDLREFTCQNQTFTSSMPFYDDPSDIMPPTNTPPFPVSPPPRRQTPSEPFKQFHQPVQTRMESQMHYFQYSHHETILEPRRPTFGFGQGFGGGGWNATSLIQLDPSWNSFVEQLGF